MSPDSHPVNRRPAPGGCFGRMFAALLAVTLAGALGGCPLQQPQRGESEPQSIVLTFDDGPLPADVADPAALNSEELLAPLHAILAVLERRGLRAVFYVKGPGTDAAAAALSDVYAQALATLHGAGHVLGYHAFDHDPRIWIDPCNPPWRALTLMDRDLDRLTAFLDGVLPRAGLSRATTFTPLFRQPYGGAGLFEPEGEAVAAARGWVYHGFRLDSFDWIVNADADPRVVARLPVETEEQRVALVLRQLRAGVARTAREQFVDVLFHVNGLTARHLDEWIDALSEASARDPRGPARIEVPDRYLTDSDPIVDLSLIADLLSA